MNDFQTVDQIVDTEFLPMRAKILELAASLDRIDRADGAPSSDQRIIKIQRALMILIDQNENRAECIQLLFSRDYSAEWRSEFELPK